MPQMERNLRHLDQLLRIERYECRALSRRKRALRLVASFNQFERI
jgi:hypothetical protein